MVTPANEIELKFLLDADQVEGVLPLLAGGERDDLAAVYFDTPDRRLARTGFGLRVRRSAKGRTQTLKAAATVEGGRSEWEWPVATDAPDPALLASTPAVLVEGETLEPVFAVRVERLTRRIDHRGSDIELALDRGEIVVGDRAAPVLELELELKAGAPSALFDLARGLMETTPLRLSAVSKAERGYRLASDEALTRPRHTVPALSSDDTAGQAFQAVAGAVLAHLAAGAESLRATPGPEGVHQVRVAVRRLRAHMAIFRPVIEGAEMVDIRTRLKWLAGELDEARNLDVFIADVWRPAAAAHHDLAGLAAFGQDLLSAQTRAYERVATAIDSPSFRRLILDATAWVQLGDWTGPAGDASRRDAPARDVVADRLSRRRRRILKAGRHLARLDRPARHRMRIEAKILRYAVEDLGGLFENHPRRRDRLTAALKQLQDSLGALNDLVFSEALARDLAIGDGEADAALAAGWLIGERSTREAALLDIAQADLKAFAKIRRFWK